MANPPRIKYVAELDHVQEVSLWGTAQFDYWQERLGKYGLSPLPLDGAAQILVIAAAARFKGFAFREVSFSVIVEPTAGHPEFDDAACLIHAFQSNRFFAFCERNFFRTPYIAAKCHVTTDPPKVEVARANQRLFACELAWEGGRMPVAQQDHGWHGTVSLLPVNPQRKCKFFVAKVSGPAQILPFDVACDTLVLAEQAGIPVLNQLVESGFAGREWIVRSRAQHAKSKTYAAW